ncbi:MAG: helix-hairpin-helix domain-containing protein, partial [Planctomycetota bacterium]
IADAIIDWRDDNDTPSTGGVESGYYENLQYGYMARNGPLRTIRELLLVKDVTDQLFFGEDTNLNGQLDYNEQDGEESLPYDDGDSELDKGWIAHLTCYSYDNNKDAEGNKKTNINSGNASQLSRSLGISNDQADKIVNGRSYDSIGDLIGNGSNSILDAQTFSKIADKITVVDSEEIPGKVNINTASEIVLAALMGGGDTAERTAQNIIAYRETLLYGMESIGELLDVPSMSVNTFKKIADLVTTRSDVYSIRCVATADRNGKNGAKLETEAVVDRVESPCKILYWYQGASN